MCVVWVASGWHSPPFSLFSYSCKTLNMMLSRQDVFVQNYQCYVCECVPTVQVVSMSIFPPDSIMFYLSFCIHFHIMALCLSFTLATYNVFWDRQCWSSYRTIHESTFHVLSCLMMAILQYLLYYFEIT